MKRIKNMTISPYLPSEYGLLACKRRLVRVTFTDQFRVKEPNKTYRALLEDVYRRIAQSPLAPIPMPSRLRADWSEKERAFILHGPGLAGFRVEVEIHNMRQRTPDNFTTASQSDLTALHGAPLPSLG